MAEDIRFPIGLLFTILGAILVIYGFVTLDESSLITKFPENANILTGAGMLVFGGIFLFMSLKTNNKKGKV